MNKRTIIDEKATSKNIERLMQERGLSAKDVQRRLGLESVQAVYKWISPNVKNIPSFDNFLLLAHMLGCHVEDIVILKDIEMEEQPAWKQ